MFKHMTKIETDNRRCDLVLPRRIVYATDGVSCAEWLLTNTDTQTQPRTNHYATLSTMNGMKAGLLLDFGTELFGGVQVITQGLSIVAGVPAKIRFGESANEALAAVGVKGACCDHGMREFDVMLPPNGCNRIGQTGFRFVYIELTEPNTFVRFYALQGVCMYRDIPYKGTFCCSDELLNKIYNTGAYTVHLCMQNLLWDGIKRDRRYAPGDSCHPHGIWRGFDCGRFSAICVKTQHPARVAERNHKLWAVVSVDTARLVLVQWQLRFGGGIVILLEAIAS